MSVAAHDSDVEALHRMGYAQELRRRMSTFSNFAVSFTIISILSGCLTLFYFGMGNGGPAGLTPRRALLRNLGPLVGPAIGGGGFRLPPPPGADLLGGQAWR